MTHIFSSFFFTVSQIIEPVKILEDPVELTPCLTDGAIFVLFSQSPSLDIVQYIVNCSGATCQEEFFDGTEGTVKAGRGIHVINVYAVNRCGQISDAAVTNPVVIENLSM